MKRFPISFWVYPLCYEPPYRGMRIMVKLYRNQQELMKAKSGGRTLRHWTKDQHNGQWPGGVFDVPEKTFHFYYGCSSGPLIAHEACHAAFWMKPKTQEQFCEIVQNITTQVLNQFWALEFIMAGASVQLDKKSL